MRQRAAVSKKAWRVFYVMILLGVLGGVFHAHAMTTGDPTSLPPAGSFGFGATVDYSSREMDTGVDQKLVTILAGVDYSVTNRLGIYMKGGLFQTESFSGSNSDWGLGVGVGLRGYFLSFRNDSVRMGFDARVFRGQVEKLYQNRSERFNYEQEITVSEYQLSAILSWRAYSPLNLYTGVQLSMTDVEFDTAFYPWDDMEIDDESESADQDHPFALLWGITYDFSENVRLYGEFRAGNEISAAAGFSFAF